MMQPSEKVWWYHAVRHGYTFVSLLVPAIYTQLDAPFGKFMSSPSPKWMQSWTVNTNAAFFFFEMPAPLTLVSTFIWAPLSSTGMPRLDSPAGFLAGLFILHYIHRAIIQPLRSPKRSPSHIVVPFAATIYNLANGGLIGAYLSSGQIAPDSWSKPAFWISVGLFFAGMFGNIYHDELLMRLRRATKSKDGKPHYGIPQGGLFSLISYPNYFCEWCEWVGFALASSVGARAPYIAPPWLFVFSEVCVMMPRALSGHKWYKQKFEDYPKERKAVIPLLL